MQKFKYTVKEYFLYLIEIQEDMGTQNTGTLMKQEIVLLITY